MDFENIINFIIVIIFIGVPLLIKLIEASSKRKKVHTPTIPEEMWSELEVETEPEPEVEIKKPIIIKKEPELKAETIIPKEKVSTHTRFSSREDLRNGIILSTILGPPRCKNRWFVRRNRSV